MIKNQIIKKVFINAGLTDNLHEILGFKIDYQIRSKKRKSEKIRTILNFIYKIYISN